MNRSAFVTQRLRPAAGAVASWLEPTLLTVTAAALTAGGAAWLTGDEGLADLLWGLGTLLAIPPAVGWVVAALRHGQAGVDLIAVLALGGTLAVHEYLAGVLIALMLATGRTLEAAARRRASHDLIALLEHAPRSARRRTAAGVSTVPLSEVAMGDLLIVGPGEVVPVDGRVEGAAAELDESVLTGESLSVERPEGDTVHSGVVNAGGAFELRATATEQDSTYAAVVRLAKQAEAGSAPVVRLADRYAAWFLPLTLAVAGGAWLLSGSAVRAVAVLVVATPCPLLLAAPVAIVSGLSRASRLGVVMRDGGALETWAGPVPCCSTRPVPSPAAALASLMCSPHPGGSRRRYSGWPRRWTSTHPMSWPRRSSAARTNGGWSCPSRPMSPRSPAGVLRAPWTGTGSPSAASTCPVPVRPGPGQWTTVRFSTAPQWPG